MSFPSCETLPQEHPLTRGNAVAGPPNCEKLARNSSGTVAGFTVNGLHAYWRERMASRRYLPRRHPNLAGSIRGPSVTRGLIDEFYIHLALLMLGEGVRPFEHPGLEPVRWARVDDGDPSQVVDLVTGRRC